MEINWLNKSIKNLVIGDFVIACSKQKKDTCFEIPYSGMAFYQTEEYVTDFQLHVDGVEPSSSSSLLFGSGDFMVPTFLYQRDNKDYDWLTKNHEGELELSFHISKDWTEFTLYEDNTGTNGVKAFREFGSLFAYAVLNHHACVLHGVVMEYNGMGILVTASSGTGKTTHTRMWRNRENALILNGDRCLCRFIDGKWYVYGMPWSGSSGEYINRRVPIKAIVCLKRGQENKVRHMSAFEGTLAMMQRVYAPVWKGEMQNQAFDMCEELATTFPVLELSCRPDYEAVDVLKAEIDNLDKK